MITETVTVSAAYLRAVQSVVFHVSALLEAAPHSAEWTLQKHLLQTALKTLEEFE